MSDDLTRAKDDALAARARLFATAQEIQDRLEPSHLIEDAVSDVRARSARLARATGDTILERPRTFGAAAAAGLLLVARRPLLRLGRRLIGRGPKAGDETE